MKALLSLNESTTAEILADLLQIDPEQAQQIAGQLRLSEILNLVQELKANNMWEANEILKPYLAELGSGTQSQGLGRAKQPPKNDPTAPAGGGTGPASGDQHSPNNVSSSTTGSQRPNLSGPETPPGEQAPNYTMDIKKDGQPIASSNVGPDGAARAIRTGPKSSGKAAGLHALRAVKGVQ
ncbi:uncharacterized protein METZ01_LOCUS122372 [marine metagenome]|uniref:Uncharacterized protein n=1 Tax=marine metagenome TaxID=408172 RepID=A0A381XXN5_9ZZZZ|tara:strand:- start:465 stop:1007 length:543 start_codon:yes stop_codon:yes gene_type:complete